MKKVLLIGGINTDVLFITKEMPKPGREIRARDMHITQGGSAANTAVWLSRLGVDAKLIGCIGDDYFGDKALRFLGKEGVDLGGICRIKGNTGVVAALVLPNGERAMVWSPGANLHVKPAMVKRRHFKGVGHLHITSLDGKKPIAALERAKEIALSMGIPVSIDPGNVLAAKGAREIAALLEGATYLMPSLGELRMLAGTRSAAFGAKRLLRYSENIVLKLGKRGVYFADRNGQNFRVAAKAKRAKDTTGAGDAFAAGFIKASLRGKPMRERILSGQKCAGVCIKKLGAV